MADTTIQYGRRSITIIPVASNNVDVATILSPVIDLGTLVKNTAWFVAGESVTQTTTGATGIVTAFDLNSGTLWLHQIVGTLNAVDVITGGTGGATGIPKAINYAFPDGMRLSAVRFYPSAANDKVVIRGKGLATGPILFDILCATAGDSSRAVGGRSLREKLYILYSECTFGTPGSCRIVLEYD